MNPLCGKNEKLLNVKAGGAYTKHFANVYSDEILSELHFGNPFNEL
jgi:hypothetical protein